MAMLITRKQDDKLEYYIQAAKIDGKYQQICTSEASINTLAELTMNEIKEINDFIKYLDDTSVDIRCKAFFTLMLDTGIRRREAVTLKWSDIKDGVIQIRQVGGTIIGGCDFLTPLPTMSLDRALQMSDYTQAVLAELRMYQDTHIKDSNQDTDLIFTSLYGHQIHPSAPYLWLQRQRQKDCMTPIGVVALRNMYTSVSSALISFSGSLSEIAEHNNTCKNLCNYACAYLKQIKNSNGANYSLLDIIHNNNEATKEDYK